MRTAISESEQSILDYHVRGWHAACQAQENAAVAISAMMGIGTDEAIDLLNTYGSESARPLIDHLGIEVYPTWFASDTFANDRYAGDRVVSVNETMPDESDPYWVLNAFAFVEWPRFWFSVALMVAVLAVCSWWLV